MSTLGELILAQLLQAQRFSGEMRDSSAAAPVQTPLIACGLLRKGQAKVGVYRREFLIGQ